MMSGDLPRSRTRPALLKVSVAVAAAFWVILILFENDQYLSPALHTKRDLRHAILQRLGKIIPILCETFINSNPLSRFQQQQQKQPNSITRKPTTTTAGGLEGIDIDIAIGASNGSSDPILIWASIDTWHKCHLLDVPDIPTRAWAVTNKNSYQTANNTSETTTTTAATTTTIHMMQGSTSFHLMTGPSLFQVTRQCQALWNKTANPDPSMFAGDEFLDSTFLFPNNNGTVVALVHTEYPGNRYNNCPGPAYPNCWIVTLGLMVSHDWGVTWQHARPPPYHLVATVPYTYNHSQLASGWGDPTNIVKHPTDGFYYVAMWNRHQVGLQAPGVCMMRTNNLMDPSSWRAWNGSHFSVSFVSPYQNYPLDDFDPANHICTVLNWSHHHSHVMKQDPLDPTKCNPFGLVWSPSKQVFLMTWACLGGYGSFHFTASQNLIDWSIPKAFYDRTNLPNATRKHVVSMQYPSLMDASAPTIFGDPNFYTVGSHPHLFWVSLGRSPYSDGRSAWATPLAITATTTRSSSQQVVLAGTNSTTSATAA